VSERYRRAGKREKGAILDQFCRTTGYHRNAAGRLLRRVGRGPAGCPGPAAAPVGPWRHPPRGWTAAPPIKPPPA
jgi:hypothetical protein